MRDCGGHVLPTLSRSLCYHAHMASVKKYSGHGVSFERVTVSTLFRYACLEFVIRGTPRDQPRPLFIFTLRGKHWAIVGGVESNHHVIRNIKVTNAGG